MKSNWLSKLPYDVLHRLEACCTKKSDLPYLVNAKWLDCKEKGRDKLGYTKEDVLVDVLDHLDCNSQWFDLTEDEWKELIK